MARVLYALFVVLALGYLAWPYASLYGLYADLKAADAEAVRARVHWPAVRADLKNDLDRFAKAAVNKALARVGKKAGGAKISLSWNALPLSDQIAGVFATPKGLIVLFQNPGAFRCVLNAIRDGAAEAVAACLRRQQETPLKKTDASGLQGPNVKRLFEKIDYAFFTGPFSFRLKVRHEDIPVTLDFSRRAQGWILVRATLSLEAVLAGDKPRS